MTAQSNARMEAELTGWLRGYEPDGTPMAFRFRTFADLRAEAEQPRRRLAMLTAKLSPLASLGTVVAGAGLLLLFAFAGASLDHSALGRGSGAGAELLGGQVASLPMMAESYSYGPSPIAIFILLVVGALAGCIVYVPQVRRAAARFAFGRSITVPSSPLPLRRRWRSVPRLTWALVALTTAVTAWSGHNFLTYTQSSADKTLLPLSVISFAGGMAQFLLPVAVSYRYSLRDRSGKLLLAGTLVPVAVMLVELAEYLFAVDYSWSAGWASLLLVSLPTAVAAISLAAGIAGRSGAAIRPPLPLAFVAVAAVFLVAMTPTVLSLTDASDLLRLFMVQWVAANVANWLVSVAWLTILWVGMSTWRQVHRSWAWLFVAAAGALQLLANLPYFISQLYQTLVPPDLTIVPDETNAVVVFVSPYYVWQLIATGSAGALLLVALVIGLRPALGGPAPGGPATEREGDLPARSAPDTEVAGEPAGH